jgi:hypothetical protein
MKGGAHVFSRIRTRGKSRLGAIVANIMAELPPDQDNFETFFLRLLSEKIGLKRLLLRSLFRYALLSE